MPAALAALAVPLVVAVVALRSPRFWPTLDLAMTEVRVRDVFGADTPLVGLPGRIGTVEQQGSHPGPLSFYALAPTYRVLGSSAWALQAATALLHLVAAATALLLARRRGGPGLVVAVAALLAVLVVGYGPDVVTEPWNPFMPVLAWVVVLLAAWSVLCRDRPAVVALVLAGSLCAQTHIPYAGLVGGVVAVVGTALVVQAVRAREPGERAATLTWIGVAVTLGVLAWLPPVLDELRGDPGNLTLIVRYFTGDDGGESPLGLGGAVALLLRLLDPMRWLSNLGGGGLLDAASDPEGSVVPGALVLAAWATAAVAAWRWRLRRLVALHVVVALALVLAVVSTSRILGKVWYYLLLSTWGTAALLVLATVWTALEAVARRRGDDGRGPVVAAGAAAAAVVLAVAVAAGVLVGVGAERSEERLSAALGAVVPGTVAGLEAGDGAAPGPDGRYLVVWDDPYHIGAAGYGLVSELERAGLDAHALPVFAVPMTPPRTIAAEDADAVVVLAVGDRIERWESTPGAVLLTESDLRSADEVVESAALRDSLRTELAAAGLPDQMVESVDGNVFDLAIDDRVPTELRDDVQRLLDLGERQAVFVLEPAAILG